MPRCRTVSSLPFRRRRNRHLQLLPDAETTEHYARLFAHLRGQGTPIPANDLRIAAQAVQHGLTLCTSDAHFRHLPQLSIC